MTDFAAIREWRVPVDGRMRDVYKVTSNGSVIWRRKMLVAFDGNGGTPSEDSRYVRYEKPVGALPTAVSEKGSFAGWYTEKEAGVAVDENTPVFAPSTYYAHWSGTTSEFIETDDGFVVSTTDGEPFEIASDENFA